METGIDGQAVIDGLAIASIGRCRRWDEFLGHGAVVRGACRDGYPLA